MKQHDRQAVPLINALLSVGVITAGEAKKVLQVLEANIDKKEESILDGVYKSIAAMEAAQTNSASPMRDMEPPKTGMPPIETKTAPAPEPTQPQKEVASEPEGNESQ